ncbi:MAG: VWA domain-containing protein [Phycisphaerales bacterium JB039]
MGLTLDDPRWLLVALLAIPAAAVALRAFPSATPVRRGAIALVRAGLIALLAILLAGASRVRETSDVAVVAVIDISGSVRRFGSAVDEETGRRMSAIERAEALIERLNEGRGPDDLLGVVVFDGQAGAVATPTRADPTGRAIDLQMRDGSDLAGALRTAAAMIPPTATGRIVLMSDGAQTRGDALDAALDVSAARALGEGSRGAIPIDVAPVQYDEPREVLVEFVDAPTRAPAESAVTLRIGLRSTTSARGTLRILADGEPAPIGPDGAMSRPVELAPGRTLELVDVNLGEGRVHRFQAVFEPEQRAGEPVGDTSLENNTAEAVTLTPGAGSALIVDGVGEGAPAGPGATLARALERSGVRTQLVAPLGVPDNLLDLQAYDIVLLQDVPADAVPFAFQELLVRYVQDLGGGLVMIGGPDSFGAGGWRGSDLEAILPVRLDLPSRLMQAQAAIVLVLDTSGSMGRPVLGSSRSQQEIANEAAAMAVATLDSTDLVGVIGFSNAPYTVAPLAPNDDPEELQARIRGIRPGGGTNLGPALEQAREALQGVDARVKHVIVLSDGRSMNAEMLPRLAQQMQADGIRISTIGVGDGADVETLDRVAAGGDGVFYRVINPNVLPRVFVRAVRVARSPMVREGAFDPVVTASGSPLTSGLGDPPPLLGVTLTAEREDPLIALAMRTPEGEPLLAHWTVGLGQVAAFTSDAHDWAALWLEWSGYQRFWTQLVRVIGRAADPGGADLALDVTDEQVRISYESTDEQGRPRDLLDVAVTVYRPDGDPVETSLVQVGPGMYEGAVPAAGSGVYVALARPSLGGTPLTPTVGGATARVGLEFGSLSSNTDLLERIAAATGGAVLDLDAVDPRAIWDRSDIEPTRARTPIWRTLVLWTLAIFLLDVGGRRVAWDRFTSSRYGGGWGAIAASVRDQAKRGGLAQATLSRVGEARGSAAAELRKTLGDRPALGAEEARQLKESAQQQRRERIISEIRQKREGRPADAGQAPATPEASDAQEGESGLFAAKRRARQRFEEDRREGRDE